MKIVLLPPSVEIDNTLQNNSIPFGLLSLHAVLKNKPDIECQILNIPSYYPTKKRIIKTAKQILSYSPDIVGFSTWYHSYPAQIRLAMELKKLNKNIIIIFGGPQATVTDEETLKAYPFIDYIFRGESEINFPQFVDVLRSPYSREDILRIPGITFFNHGQIIKTNNVEFIKNLDSLPIASYELQISHNPLRLDVGRGCPYDCSFCSTKDYFDRKYRMKTIGRIVKEILYARKCFGTTNFHIIHDCFTANKDFAIEFCNEIITRRLKIRWACMTRVDCVDENLIQLMSQAGCCEIMYGIETGSGRMQKIINKRIKLNNLNHSIDIALQNNIEVYCNFIIGFPQETENDLDETFRTIIQVKLLGSKVNIHILNILPGTNLYIKYYDRLKYDGYYFSHTNCLLTTEEEKMVLAHPEIFSGFYFLETPAASREQIILFCSIANWINYFPDTVKTLLINHYLPNNLCKKIKFYLEDKLSRTDINKNAIRGLFISFLKNQIAHHKNNDRIIFELEKRSFLLRFRTPPASKSFKLSPNPENLIKSYIVRKSINWTFFETNYNIKNNSRDIPTPKRKVLVWGYICSEIAKVKCYYVIMTKGEYDFEAIKITHKKYQILKQIKNGETAISLWEKIQQKLDRHKAFAFWNSLLENELIWIESRTYTKGKFLKVLLIPPNPGRDANGNESFLNTGLLSLAAVLRKMKGISFSLYNAPLIFKRKSTLYYTIQKVVQLKPDVIGFSTWCHVYSAQLLLAKYIKARLPSCKIIFGGPQATTTDRLTLQNFPEVDYIIRGEAEFSFPMLLRYLSSANNKTVKLKEIHNLTYRDKDIIRQNQTTIIKNLDRLPTPAYDLLRAYESVSLDIGRGCPYKCSFCSTSVFFGRKFRIKSPDIVLNEIQSIYKRFRTIRFDISHDNFTVNHKYLKALCQKLYDFDLPLKWICMSRTDNMNNDILTMLARSGCYLIGYGIETGSDAMQKKIKKKLNLEQAVNIVLATKKLKIMPACSIIIGYPEETYKDLNDSLRLFLYLLNAGVDINLNLLAPLPATEIYEKYKDKLLFDGYSTVTPYIDLLDEEKYLIKKYPKIFSSFYFVPTKAISHNHLILLLNIAYLLKNYIYTTKLLSYAFNLSGKKDLLAIYKNWINKDKTIQKINKYGLEKLILQEIDLHLIPQAISKDKKFLILQEIFSLEKLIGNINNNYLKTHPKLVYDTFTKEPIIYNRYNWDIFQSSFDLTGIIYQLNNNKFSSVKKLPQKTYYLVSLKEHGDFGYRGFNLTKITKFQKCALQKLPKKITYKKFCNIAHEYLSGSFIDDLLIKLKENGCAKVIQ